MESAAETTPVHLKHWKAYCVDSSVVLKQLRATSVHKRSRSKSGGALGRKWTGGEERADLQDGQDLLLKSHTLTRIPRAPSIATKDTLNDLSQCHVV